MNFYFGDMVAYSGVLLEALWASIYISVFAMSVGGALGVLVYLGKARAPRLLRAVSAGYIEVFRNTPLLVQLYLVYFGLPQVGIDLNPITAGLVTFTLNNAAYIAEIYRAGFDSVPLGQQEAGRALGLNSRQIFRHISFAQAIRSVFPALTNQFILLFLASSIASIIGLPELMTAILNINSATYLTIEIFAVGGLLYYATSALFALGSRLLEAKLFRWGGAARV